MQNIEKL